MQVNLTAAAQLCRHAVLHWHERGRPGEKTGGRIVNIASRAAYRGDSPAHWHYAASKSGMVAMTQTIARAYAKDGILAFAICPGFTMTGLADDYLARDRQGVVSGEGVSVRVGLGGRGIIKNKK